MVDFNNAIQKNEKLVQDETESLRIQIRNLSEFVYKLFEKKDKSKDNSDIVMLQWENDLINLIDNFSLDNSGSQSKLSWKQVFEIKNINKELWSVELGGWFNNSPKISTFTPSPLTLVEEIDVSNDDIKKIRNLVERVGNYVRNVEEDKLSFKEGVNIYMLDSLCEKAQIINSLIKSKIGDVNIQSDDERSKIHSDDISLSVRRDWINELINAGKNSLCKIVYSFDSYNAEDLQLSWVKTILDRILSADASNDDLENLKRIRVWDEFKKQFLIDIDRIKDLIKGVGENRKELEDIWKNAANLLDKLWNIEEERSKGLDQLWASDPKIQKKLFDKHFDWIDSGENNGEETGEITDNISEALEWDLDVPKRLLEISIEAIETIKDKLKWKESIFNACIKKWNSDAQSRNLSNILSKISASLKGKNYEGFIEFLTTECKKDDNVEIKKKIIDFVNNEKYHNSMTDINYLVSELDTFEANNPDTASGPDKETTSADVLKEREKQEVEVLIKNIKTKLKPFENEFDDCMNDQKRNESKKLVAILDYYFKNHSKEFNDYTGFIDLLNKVNSEGYEDLPLMIRNFVESKSIINMEGISYTYFELIINLLNSVQLNKKKNEDEYNKNKEPEKLTYEQEKIKNGAIIAWVDIKRGLDSYKDAFEEIMTNKNNPKRKQLIDIFRYLGNTDEPATLKDFYRLLNDKIDENDFSTLGNFKSFVSDKGSDTNLTKMIEILKPEIWFLGKFLQKFKGFFKKEQAEIVGERFDPVLEKVKEASNSEGSEVVVDIKDERYRLYAADAELRGARLESTRVLVPATLRQSYSRKVEENEKITNITSSSQNEKINSTEAAVSLWEVIKMSSSDHTSTTDSSSENDLKDIVATSEDPDTTSISDNQEEAANPFFSTDQWEEEPNWIKAQEIKNWDIIWIETTDWKYYEIYWKWDNKMICIESDMDKNVKIAKLKSKEDLIDKTDLYAKVNLIHWKLDLKIEKVWKSNKPNNSPA